MKVWVNKMDAKEIGHSRKRKTFKNKDFISIILTIILLFSLCFYLIFITVHTNVDVHKNEKGEVNISVDYSVDNEVEMPGKDLFPMMKQVLEIVKKKLD